MARFLRRVLGVSLIGLMTLAVPAGSTRPNVIIVLVDDAGYGDWSCLGNPIIKTPNIDRAARRKHALHGFSCRPMCTPTRVAADERASMRCATAR